MMTVFEAVTERYVLSLDYKYLFLFASLGHHSSESYLLSMVSHKKKHSINCM